MSLLKENFRLLYVGVAAGVYYRPEYVIFNSKIITILIYFAIISLAKFIHQVALYPAFFTPIKHIQTPGVRSIK